MPARHALGQHPALTSRRHPEMLFTYLDVLCDPSRVAEIVLQVKQPLQRAAGIQLNLGETNVWKSEAIKSEELDRIRGVARRRIRGRKRGWSCWASASARLCRNGWSTRRVPFAVSLPNPSGAWRSARGCSPCCAPNPVHTTSSSTRAPSEVFPTVCGHVLAVSVPDGAAAEVVQFPLREGARQGPTGRPGQIACRRCMPEHHLSALSF